MHGGMPRLYLDWYSPDGTADGDNCEAALSRSEGWRRYRMEVRLPDLKAEQALSLRFVAYANAQDLLVDGVRLWERH